LKHLSIANSYSTVILGILKQRRIAYITELLKWVLQLQETYQERRFCRACPAVPSRCHVWKLNCLIGQSQAQKGFGSISPPNAMVIIESEHPKPFVDILVVNPGRRPVESDNRS
jgi:hypothetical protein